MKLLILTTVIAVNEKQPWIFDLYLNTLKTAIRNSNDTLDQIHLWVFSNEPARLRKDISYMDLKNKECLIKEIIESYNIDYTLFSYELIKEDIDRNTNISVAHSYSIDYMMNRVFNFDINENYDFVLLTDFDMSFQKNVFEWINGEGDQNTVMGCMQNSYSDYHMNEWQKQYFDFNFEVPRIDPFFFVMGSNFIKDINEFESSCPIWEYDGKENIYGDTCSLYLNQVSSVPGIKTIFYHEDDIPLDHKRNYTFNVIRHHSQMKDSCWKTIKIKNKTIEERFYG